MLKKLGKDSAMQVNDNTLWLILRLVLACLLAAHGWIRLLDGGVEPFGIWLDSKGLLVGAWIAWSITLFEITGTILLAFRKWVLPLCLLFSLIYSVGIVMVHAPAGWFVVGAGRNGAEYSVFLIIVLMCVGLHHAKGGSATRNSQ